MNKVKIKSVKIEVGKNKFNLTVEEAKELKNVLEELFGKEIIKEIKDEHHHYHGYPYYYFYPPISEPQTPISPVFYCSNSAVEYTGNETLKITC